MSAHGATLAFYEREAPAYCASWPDEPSRHLDGFLDRLPTGAAILELGCGGGRDAARMIERGFDVRPIDGSPAMARQAERRLGRPVTVLRLEELDESERFDAVWASASLLHAPRDQLVDVLARVWRALKPGGWHFASYKTGEAESGDRLGRRFNFPDAALLTASYHRAGEWTAIEIDEFAGSGYDGVPRRWLAIMARKPGRGADMDEANR